MGTFLAQAYENFGCIHALCHSRRFVRYFATKAVKPVIDETVNKREERLGEWNMNEQAATRRRPLTRLAAHCGIYDCYPTLAGSAVESLECNPTSTTTSFWVVSLFLDQVPPLRWLQTS